jgi:hypothetical protein
MDSKLGNRKLVEKSNPYFMDREIAEKIALLKNFNVISFEEKPVKVLHLLPLLRQLIYGLRRFNVS